MYLYSLFPASKTLKNITLETTPSSKTFSYIILVHADSPRWHMLISICLHPQLMANKVHSEDVGGADISNVGYRNIKISIKGRIIVALEKG